MGKGLTLHDIRILITDAFWAPIDRGVEWRIAYCSSLAEAEIRRWMARNAAGW